MFCVFLLFNPNYASFLFPLVHMSLILLPCVLLFLTELRMIPCSNRAYALGLQQPWLLSK
jgi:hypothetical protein